MPNSSYKSTQNYDKDPAPFFTTEAINYINELSIKHLLVDIPSIDKANDNGFLGNHHSFFIKGDKKYHQVHTEDILFIEAYGHYSKLYLKNEMILTNEKISAFEDLLSEDNFLRIHKSFIVNVDHIKLIEGNRISIYEHKIPIGQTYKNNIDNLYNS